MLRFVNSRNNDNDNDNSGKRAKKLTSRLELLVVGVRLPLAKPASMDLVLRDACSFGSTTGTRWGGTLGLYSIIRLLLHLGGVITEL